MHKFLLIPLLGMLIACQPSPRPIDYGQDACHYCKMTVVDQQHAAEAVTDKGKVFVFDAIECLVNYREEHPEQAYSYLLVNDYQQPGALIPAAEATYLVSENIPSPMGAFLSAFASQAAAKRVQAKQGGELYQWQEL